jgi:hypothetical protein
MKAMRFLGPEIFVFALVILDGPSVAGPLDVEVLTPQSSVESRCRAAVRAELKGPNCRQEVYVHNTDLGTVGPCYVPTYQQPYFMDKVIQCVAHGGPGHAPR